MNDPIFVMSFTDQKKRISIYEGNGFMHASVNLRYTVNSCVSDFDDEPIFKARTDDFLQDAIDILRIAYEKKPKEGP